MKDVELDQVARVSSARKKEIEQPSSVSSGSKAGVGGKLRKWFWSLVHIRRKREQEDGLKKSDSVQTEDGASGGGGASLVMVYQEEGGGSSAEEAGLLNAIRALETEGKRGGSLTHRVPQDDGGRSSDVTNDDTTAPSSQHTIRTIFRNDSYREEDEEEVEEEVEGVGRLREFESAVRVIEGSKKRIYEAIGEVPSVEDAPLIVTTPPPQQAGQRHSDLNEVKEKSGAEEELPVEETQRKPVPMKLLFSPDPPSLTKFLFTNKTRVREDDWDLGHEGDDEESHDGCHDHDERHEYDEHEETATYLLLVPSNPSFDLHLTDSLTEVNQWGSTTGLNLLDEFLLEEVISLGQYDGELMAAADQDISS